MPCLIKAVVQLARTSGLSADHVNNDFYFLASDMDEVSSGRADALTTLLTSFYNDVHLPGTVDLASSIATTISRSSNECSISFYSVEDPATYPIVWGSPKEMRNWTLQAAAAGNNLPGEVACVLTYHSDLTDVPETQTNPSPPPAIIRPAARRRGRLFIGPLNTQTLSQQSPTFEPFPNVLLSNAMLGGGANVRDVGAPNTDWVVLSQTEQTSFVVTGGWVDNAFDSQRRRGNAADVRTTF